MPKKYINRYNKYFIPHVWNVFRHLNYPGYYARGLHGSRKENSRWIPSFDENNFEVNTYTVHALTVKGNHCMSCIAHNDNFVLNMIWTTLNNEVIHVRNYRIEKMFYISCSPPLRKPLATEERKKIFLPVFPYNEKKRFMQKTSKNKQQYLV